MNTVYGYVLIGAFIKFYLYLICRYFLPPTPEIVTNDLLELGKHHLRRYTLKYRRKREIVKTLWISAGLVTLVCPVLQFAMCLGLFTTCISFAILDETQ